MVVRQTTPSTRSQLTGSPGVTPYWSELRPRARAAPASEPIATPVTATISPSPNTTRRICRGEAIEPRIASPVYLAHPASPESFQDLECAKPASGS